MKLVSFYSVLLTLVVLTSCAGEAEVLPEENEVSLDTLKKVPPDSTDLEAFENEEIVETTPLFEDRYGSGIVVFDLFHLDLLETYPYLNEDEDPFANSHPKVRTFKEEERNLLRSKLPDWDFFAYYPDYDIMHVIGLGQNEMHELNLIRLDSSDILGISMDDCIYYSWEDYLLEFAFSLDPINDDGLYDGVIRAEPSDEAEDISESSDFGVAWVPVEFEGNWAKIEVYEGACQEGEVQKFGWIKWRDDYKLLVRLAYVC